MAASPSQAAHKAGGGRGFPWPAAGVAVLIALAMAGTGLLLAAFNAPVRQPPQPASEAAPSASAVADVNRAKAKPAPGLDRSVPLEVTIPSIGVETRIMTLGLNDDGSVQVPPRSKANFAGWYERGPSPGEIGNAVLVGHVDTAKMGPAAFYDIGMLEPGDTVEVTRKDGKVVEFTVDGTQSFPKDKFPSGLVYGPADQAQLRLVTCGGTWSKESAYPNNIVVFATQSDVTAG
jgi:sortase (surface protein transpeptidase)